MNNKDDFLRVRPGETMMDSGVLGMFDSREKKTFYKKISLRTERHMQILFILIMEIKSLSKMSTAEKSLNKCN